MIIQNIPIWRDKTKLIMEMLVTWNWHTWTHHTAKFWGFKIQTWGLKQSSLVSSYQYYILFFSYSLRENKLVWSKKLFPCIIKSINPIQKYPCINEWIIFLYSINICGDILLYISFVVYSTAKLSRYVKLSILIVYAPTFICTAHVFTKRKWTFK